MGHHRESAQQKQLEAEQAQEIAQLQAEEEARKREAKSREDAVISRALGGGVTGNIPTTGGKPSLLGG